jgi:hypothetical protein
MDRQDIRGVEEWREIVRGASEFEARRTPTQQ